MTTPTAVPPVPPAVDVDAVAEAVAATRKERTKTFAKKAFTRVGVPVLIGTAAAYVASRRLAKQDDSQLELTASTEE